MYIAAMCPQTGIAGLLEGNRGGCSKIGKISQDIKPEDIMELC
jgi:hypothetical protein